MALWCVWLNLPKHRVVPPEQMLALDPTVRPAPLDLLTKLPHKALSQDKPKAIKAQPPQARIHAREV
jgi:hypothetical protein